MSEGNEHTSEENEAEMNAGNQSDEQSKSETSMLNNETEQPMLEDEEMPTYISVSSPSRREHFDVSNTKQQERIPMEEDRSRSPYLSDDQGGCSVYVLSSGEDSNPPYNDEEEDEYADSEDMDEMDLENEHENAMLEEEEEEDEEDEDEGNFVRMQNDDEDIDHPLFQHIEDPFYGASDDFVLNNRVKECHKKRSLSLQDLNTSKRNVHVPCNMKRYFLNIFRQNQLDKPMHVQQNSVLYPVTHKRQSVLPKFQYADSKDVDAGLFEHVEKSLYRTSDDFVLNNRVKQFHTKRSLSLQDLSTSKHNVHVPNKVKRYFLNIFRQNHLEKPMHFQQNSVAHPVSQKRHSLTPKYQHVESKVKQYIRDIKEQNRRSIERRIKEQEYISNKNYEENESKDIDNIKPTVTNKTIKDYAEKAIKDLQRDENDEDDNPVYKTAQLIENGENNIQNDKCAQNCDDRLEKRNGSVDVNMHHIEYQNSFDRNERLNNIEQSSLVNGRQQTPTLFNLRTLSYEEYMHGIPNSKQKEELSDPMQRIQGKANNPSAYNQAEIVSVQETDNTNTSCSLKIESVKSIRIAQNETDNSNFVKVNTTDKTNTENAEIIQLKAQLIQKDAGFNNLRDAYEKVLAENIKMKGELDALKKSITKYENEKKPCETKVASVQTETIIEPTQTQETSKTSEETKNKISSSSVASTISSIDQWADSACSPAISIKPPDLTQVLNSDDSIVLTDGTPARLAAHPLSRTFLTSSRILQTLSSITQGKSKTESPLVKNSKTRTNENSIRHLLHVGYNSPIQASSSKKRKATDMLGSSAFDQPFKIPHTSTESEERRRNSVTSIDLNHSREHVTSKTEERQNASVSKDEDNFSSLENKIENTDDHDDSVKCFIYRDQENSKNRSFLIQTEEPMKDGVNSEKGRIQECGPYLLGNLEVRMSEIDGTISVWGKEISPDSMSDNEDDMETSVEKKTCPCWQKTPQTRFNDSPFMCSTSKKQKIPFRFNRSGGAQCFNTLSPNAIKSAFMMDDVNDKKHVRNHLSPHTSVPSCENCDSAKCRNEWLTRRSISNSQEKLHSCCTNHTEFVEKEYNCNSCHEKQKCHDILNHSKDKFHMKEGRRNSYRNSLMPDLNNYLHKNVHTAADMNEVTCKCNSCRRSFQNIADTSHSKCCNASKDISCTYKVSLNNTSRHENCERQTSSPSFSNDCEEDPLISHKQSTETFETRRRRLSGKRVRGILMDLLKGCGDCRSTNAAGMSKSSLQYKESPCATNAPPQIKISPCPKPESQNSTQCKDRCCHAYARRIESQLEEFRMEMERVRSRSDAILDMLNMLRSVDMN